jgi:DNA-binding beta-propeller fold protein YncE
MNRSLLSLSVTAVLALGSTVSLAASPIAGITKVWTYSHASTGVIGQTSEIPAFDPQTATLWVVGVKGVDVLNVNNGSLVSHIDTSAFGAGANSVAIANGLAAVAIESATRTDPGVVNFYNTATRQLAAGFYPNSVTVGALPDMLTFTPDGSKLLVANEGTPSTYGAQIGSTTPRNFAAAALDPAGSVSIIHVATRSVIATPGFGGVPQTGENLRTNTGMDFEPEYIAVNATGTKAFVGLQEANGMAVLDLTTNSFQQVVGLGAKDFSLPGNSIDPRNNASVSFIAANAKGLYMPDALATYQAGGKTYVVMANEGDFREDDADRSAASSLGATDPLDRLRISNTDSSAGNLFAAGARSFSIRDENGVLIYDSGSLLDMKAHEKGIYDDGRSRDKGVEPEGVTLMELNGRTLAFIGLERTTKSAVAIFDVTDPLNVSYVDMIVTDGDVSPEGLAAFALNGQHFLAIANEVSGTTTLYSLTPVPEPESYALMLAGLAAVGYLARRRKNR